MALFNENKDVCTGTGVILWDGITTPDKNEDGTIKCYSLKVAFPDNQPELGELNYVAQQELTTGIFKGRMPNGGLSALSSVDPEILPGHTSINPKSFRGCPQVFDATGKVLQPMQYGNMLYPGCKVKVLVACRSYDNKSKGLGWWLNGIQIVDATAPKLDIGGGGPDAAAIFGGQPAAAPAYAPPAPAYAPPAPAYAPPAPAYAPPVAPAYAPPVAPAMGFLSPPVPGMALPPNPPAPVPVGPQMTAAAGGASYDQMIAAGWTDATLRQHGMMI